MLGSKLIPLTIIEELLISPVRLYGSFIKVASDPRERCHMLMHVISFFHGGAEEFMDSLKVRFPNFEQIKEVKIIFVGDKHQFEKTRQFAMKNLHGMSVRPQVVIDHLMMHKVIHLYCYLCYQ